MNETDKSLLSTGIPELDTILGGGLAADRLYLIEGSPGTGKTTMALQFLLEGIKNGEPGLYVTLSETKPELIAVAQSHGWSLDGLEIYELIDPSDSLEVDAQYTMFEPSEIELGKTIRGVLEKVSEIKPRRVALDSLSEMRLLAQSPLRYRRQILALKQFFVGRDCTVLLLDDKTSHEEDQQLQSIAHGVISLTHVLSDYGGERRRLRVIEYRGQRFEGGSHDFHLGRGGIQVFPRKGLIQPPQPASLTPLASGNSSLDSLLGDGLMPGTSTLLLGPAGVGKSSCATLYAVSAARRGERAVIFIFDESREALLKRSKGLGMDLDEYLDAGLLTIYQLDPGEVAPGEFAHIVREAVRPDVNGIPASVVVIDSLNGYLNSMPNERYLTIQMHELLKHLGHCRVVTFLVVAQHGMLGQSMLTPVDTSYLADAVILFRYFEAGGSIHQAISVVKKRTGGHERTIRELRMNDGEIRIGPPLKNFHGILAGTPTFTGASEDLMRIGADDTLD
ncbi:MAG: ATPase domain-containing protein [Planctomycetaceae bacterium]